MTYRILRHPDVGQDLEDIADLIMAYAGVDIAIRKLDQIETTLNGLSKTPHIGSLRDAIVPGLRVIPSASKAVICFVVDDSAKEVLVLAIGYTGSDWVRHVSRRN